MLSLTIFMVNSLRASRQFERTFGINTNAPRQDHMNLEELSRNPPRDITVLEGDEVLVCKIIYQPDEEKVSYQQVKPYK